MDYFINNQSDFDARKNSTFAPGDKIFFKRGISFNGQFAPKGSGVNGNPIVIDAYSSGDRPLLQGNGIVDGISNAPLYLYNQEYWEINNLEITNTDGSNNDQGDLRGIYVVGDNGTTLNHIYIRNCYIHDVNGKVAGKIRGGIHFHVNGTAPTKFNDVKIENNFIENIGGVGIGNQSSRRNRFEVNNGDGDWLPWTNYVIRNNWINNTGRNCIIVRVSEQAVVEYNTFVNSSRYGTGHSIFCFNTDNCTIQYNEGYGNTGNINEVDRGSFDADWNCQLTRIQYNYSHDNNYSFGIMRRKNSRFKIRYNISQNENYAIFFYGFDQSTDGIDSGDIYNNTIFFNSNGEIFEKNAQGGGPIDTRFWNNIFYFGTSGDWGRNPNSTLLFENNCYYNFTGGSLGSGAITTNPLLVNPGTGGQGIDMHDSNRLSGYKLKANSPCRDSGINVSFNGGKDFWGNSLYQGSLPDIGAHEFSGDSFTITGTKKLICRQGTNLALAAVGNTDNSNVVKSTYTGSTLQNWEITDLGNGYYTLACKDGGRLLTAFGMEDNTNVKIYGTDTPDWRQWEIIDLNNGYFALRCKFSGKLLTALGTASGTNAKVFSIDDTEPDYRQWEILEP